MSENNKYLALLRLKEGEKPTDIAEELNISYAAVIRYKKEMEEADKNGKLAMLLADSIDLLDETAANIAAQVPGPYQDELADQLMGKVDGVKGLNKLSLELQDCASHLVKRIKAMSYGIEHVSELTELTTSLSKIQTAFFGGPSTQVNIQNNVGEQRYGSFLADKPGKVR